MKIWMSICIAIALFFSNLSTGKAQYYDQAIGVRAGTSFSLTYKRFLFYTPEYPQMAIEGMLSFQLDEIRRRQNGVVLEALYYIHLDLGFDTGFSGFIGLGGYGGIYVEPGQPTIPGGGFTAAVGVSYTFSHIPLNIALDWKPLVGFPRISATRGAITFRYILPTAWQ